MSLSRSFHRNLQRTPRRLRRFEQEAQAASALNHSNIATIYGIDSQDGTSFIAMEYVPGRTLAELIPPTAWT